MNSHKLMHMIHHGMYGVTGSLWYTPTKSLPHCLALSSYSSIAVSSNSFAGLESILFSAYNSDHRCWIRLQCLQHLNAYIFKYFQFIWASWWTTFDCLWWLANIKLKPWTAAKSCNKTLITILMCLYLPHQNLGIFWLCQCSHEIEAQLLEGQWEHPTLKERGASYQWRHW